MYCGPVLTRSTTPHLILAAAKRLAEARGTDAETLLTQMDAAMAKHEMRSGVPWMRPLRTLRTNFEEWAKDAEVLRAQE